ncbi:odorant binding protein [Rhyzopertha dominica]|nr:odorant binding protein [Rhyzopertha dominica]
MNGVVLLFTLFALTTVAYAAISEDTLAEIMEKMVSLAQECQKETGATQEDMTILMQKKIPASHEGKCVISCIAKKTGVSTQDGHADIEATKKFFEKFKNEDEDLYNKVIEMSEQCQKEVPYDEDHCISAINFAKCAKEKSAQKGIKLPWA